MSTTIEKQSRERFIMKLSEVKQEVKAARALAAAAQAERPSRELACAMTKLDEAALWLAAVPGELGPDIDTLI